MVDNRIPDYPQAEDPPYRNYDFYGFGKANNPVKQ